MKKIGKPLIRIGIGIAIMYSGWLSLALGGVELVAGAVAMSYGLFFVLYQIFLLSGTYTQEELNKLVE